MVSIALIGAAPSERKKAYATNKVSRDIETVHSEQYKKEQVLD